VLETLYRAYGERASIYVVYIAEAHAVDEWQMDSNEAEEIRIRQHATFEERLAAARLCEQRLGLSIPTLVDHIDNCASEKFAAWPERIYIAGPDGRIVFAGGPGPYEFSPEAAEAALCSLLDASELTAAQAEASFKATR
jgi:hypothetical protein